MALTTPALHHKVARSPAVALPPWRGRSAVYLPLAFPPVSFRMRAYLLSLAVVPALCLAARPIAAQAFPSRTAARAAITAKKRNPDMTIEVRTRNDLLGPCEAQEEPEYAMAMAKRVLSFRTVEEYGTQYCRASFTKEGLALPAVDVGAGVKLPPIFRRSYDTTVVAFVVARDSTGPVSSVSVGPRPGTVYADYSWGWMPTDLGREFADQLKMPFGVPFGTMKSDRATLRRSDTGWALETTASLEELKARGSRRW